MLLSVQFVIKLSRSFSSSSSYHVPQTLPLQTLLKRGFSPTLKSINQFFFFLSQTHRFNLIIHFFSQLKSNRIKSNSKILSIVTRALLKLHKFEEAEYFMTTQVEKSSPLPLSRLWDSLIKGFCIKRKDPEKALSVLKDCLRNHGILPSSFTFCAIIYCFTSSGNMSRAVEVLELMTSETIKYPFDNFVCSAVISGFCKIEKPELAIGFFENALSSGALRPNVVTYTALVSALCKLDRLNEVGNLVCQMEKEGLEFDVIFYSSWIFGYLREGALMDAFREHGKMMKKGIKPDTISYTLLIDGLSKEANVEKAVGFLTKMIKSGLKPNFITYTAILQGFCKKEKLEDAITLFKKFGDMGIEVDEFMYATLIDGICKRGDLDYVFHLLADMEKRGIKPSIVTYNTVINGLCKGGRMLEADMVSKGVLGDVVTFSTLLHGYIQEENVNGILETKQRFELAGVSMDAVMCNILLKAQLMVGAFEDAHALYQSMPEMNLHADSVTYCTMIDGYCRVGRIEEALEVFDEFRNTSLSSIACYNCIINALCKKGMLDMAIEVFVELYEKGLALDIGVYKKLLSGIFAEVGAEGVLNLVYRLQNLRSDLYDIICNGAISFLCKRGSPEAASEVHMVMRRNGSVVSSKSYYTILKGFHADRKNALFRPFLTVFAKEYGLIQPRVKKMILFYLCMKDVDKALLFLKRMKENASAVRLPASLFKKLIEDGRALDAYELLMGAEDSLSYMDVVDYTLMVDGLCKGGYPDKAICLCAFAKRKGITLNIITYNSIINGLCRQGCFVEAFRLFDSLERIDLVPSIVTYAILIDYLCKEGFILDAKKLFDRMVLKGFKPNIHVYNSFICGYCKFGQMGEALKLLSDLEVNNLTPDEFTISAIINGCYQKGDMEEALVLFVEFKRKGLSPDFLGFLHLTRGLCNKGRMEEARSILREMLQSKSVGELLSRVDKEVESESIKSFLADLCERGSINEAVTILDEISSIFIPTLGNLSAHHGPKIPHKPYECENSAKVTSGFIICSEKTDLGSDKNDLNKEEVVLRYIDSTGKRSQCRDFGLYYSHINSLCLKGELQQAKRLVKIMLSSMHGKL